MKSARIEAGLTQEALAEKIGVVLKIAKDYEGDRRNPKTDRWPVIAEALGKPIGWFFEDSEKDKLPEPQDSGDADKGDPLSEAALLRLFAKQQDLLSDQSGQINRLTVMLERQQDHFISTQQWQQKLVGSQVEKLEKTINELRAEVEQLKAQQAHRPPRGRHTQFDAPARPGEARAGG